MNSTASPNSRLKIYPETAFEPADYLRAMLDVVHDPLSSALVPVNWYGTEAYQRVIEKTGFEPQQRVLRELVDAIHVKVEELAGLKRQSEPEAAPIGQPKKGDPDLPRKIEDAESDLRGMYKAEKRLRVALVRHVELLNFGPGYFQHRSAESGVGIDDKRHGQELQSQARAAVLTPTVFAFDKPGDLMTRDGK